MEIKFPKHDCKTCKHNGGIVPQSGHHIKCIASGTELYEMIFSNSCIQENGSHRLGLDITNTDTGETLPVPVIKLNPHGIKNGWCDWPMVFDPIWVEQCLLYDAVEGTPTVLTALKGI